MIELSDEVILKVGHLLDQADYFLLVLSLVLLGPLGHVLTQFVRLPRTPEAPTAFEPWTPYLDKRRWRRRLIHSLIALVICAILSIALFVLFSCAFDKATSNDGKVVGITQQIRYLFWFALLTAAPILPLYLFSESAIARIAPS